MKTSIEMQLKILDKMRENLENGLEIMSYIQFKGEGQWIDKSQPSFEFDLFEYRVEPSTITINGVEIPKYLHMSEMLGDVAYYCVDNSEFLHKQRKGQAIVDQGVMFAYETKEEAIEASKLLFGIK